MIKFLDTKNVSVRLNVSGDEVRYLLREGKLYARKSDGPKGGYLINSVDVERMQMLRTLLENKQNPTKPDMLWVQAACEYLANEIILSTFDPALIIGIAYGGLVPAAYISTILRKPFFAISASHYDDRERLTTVSVSIANLWADFKDRLLIVDDIADTGETLLEVKRKFVEREVLESNIRFATLHRKPESKFEPDWFVAIVDGWVTYPWESAPLP